jgi:catechol 2,3-dioxygenase-like lactoylglutathione lyase family enzyme
MISGGNATVFVSNMDAAVHFYTDVLGLKLTNRFGNHWATVDAGRGLIIGLHPASPKHPAPGTKGAITIGLEINEPIQDVVKRLQTKGVHFNGPIVTDEPGSFADFEDPDGNSFYLWEMNSSGAKEKAYEMRMSQK